MLFFLACLPAPLPTDTSGPVESSTQELPLEDLRLLVAGLGPDLSLVDVDGEVLETWPGPQEALRVDPAGDRVLVQGVAGAFWLLDPSTGEVEPLVTSTDEGLLYPDGSAWEQPLYGGMTRVASDGEREVAMVWPAGGGTTTQASWLVEGDSVTPFDALGVPGVVYGTPTTLRVQDGELLLVAAYDGGEALLSDERGLLAQWPVDYGSSTLCDFADGDDVVVLRQRLDDTGVVLERLHEGDVEAHAVGTTAVAPFSMVDDATFAWREGSGPYRVVLARRGEEHVVFEDAALTDLMRW